MVISLASRGDDSEVKPCMILIGERSDAIGMFEDKHPEI